jgi:hypothetical protein
MNKSLTELIGEADFLPLAQEYAQGFLRIYNSMHEDDWPRSRKFYSHLIEQAEELENFLDDHGARDNRTWFLMGELVACVRNLAKVAFILKHIVTRLPAYDLENKGIGKFEKTARTASEYFDETILRLFEAIKAETLKLGIRFPADTLDESLLKEIYPQKCLPYTIDEEEVLDAREVVAKIATKYLHVIQKFDSFGWDFGKNGSVPTKEWIPNKLNEENSREVLALVHNLQSTYDHSVKRTPLEGQDKRLKKFRGYVSMPLHLLSVVNWLSHFCQRHLQKVGPGKAGYDLSAIIDEDRLLTITVDFALFYSDTYLRAGKRLANSILAEYTEVGSCELNVPRKLGFHLRPATLVARLVNYHGTELTMMVDGQQFDAASVLSITMGAGLIARHGYKTVVFKGDRRILHDLKILAECNYGEDETGNRTELPPELNYLFT